MATNLSTTGEPAAAEHLLAVVRDLLSRYAVDGLHLDDYFYPTPPPPAARAPSRPLRRPCRHPWQAELDFPDGPSWQAYVMSGGQLAASRPGGATTSTARRNSSTRWSRRCA